MTSGSVEERGRLRRRPRSSPRQKRGKIARREERWFYVFIAPWLVGFLLFGLGPILASVGLAFTDYNFSGWPNFIGLDNFERMVDPVQGPLLAKAIRNTLYIALLVIPLQIIIGLGLALLLSQEVRGMPIFRTAFYLPTVVSGVATIVVWIWILGSDGLLNQGLQLIGIDGPVWLRDPSTVKLGIVLIMVWGGTGGMMIIFLAGLQAMPREMLEAAAVDGAAAFRRFWHVTLPLLTPQLFFNLVIGIAGGLGVFTETWVVSSETGPGGSGSPANQTLTLVMYIYRQLLQNLQVGYASAVAWVFTGAIALLTAIQFWSSRRWVYYDIEN
ncbi:MAG: sugar ABC transporter permease [Acidimicrobiia bacterium]|nr:sugar ABC transporter permease [Acidimicrobiia bacterium]